MGLPVELPVLLHDEESRQQEMMGIESKLGDGPSGITKFYTIDCVTPFIDDERYTIVGSGGHGIIVTLPYEEVIKRIEA